MIYSVYKQMLCMSRLSAVFFAGSSEVSDYSLDGKQQKQQSSKNRHFAGD